MGKEQDKAVEITTDEINRLIAGLDCREAMRTRLRRLVGAYGSPRLFLKASDGELSRKRRCGKGMMALVAKLREECYFIMKDEEARFRCHEEFAEYMKRKEAEHRREIALLNPVFTVNDLQAAALYMAEEKVEFIDLRLLNAFRHSVTAAQKEEMRRRHEEAERERREREAAEAKGKEAGDAEER